MTSIRRRANPVLRRLGPRLLWPSFLEVEAGVGEGLLISLRRASADYATGDNEPAVQQVLADRLATGAVFFDIGANVGFFSLIGARLVGPRGRVIAFEPVAANADALRVNVQRNRLRNIQVVEAAVGRAPGKAPLRIVDHPGGSTLAIPATTDEITGVIDVEVVSVDELVAERTVPPPDLVKVDVEGLEEAALEGMYATLVAHRPVVVCEIDGPTAEAIEERTSPIEQMLRAAGYRVALLPPAYLHTEWHVVHLLATPDATAD